nr:MAG TPA: hypothetical protein [Bacteriophage sp.]
MVYCVNYTFRAKANLTTYSRNTRLNILYGSL